MITHGHGDHARPNNGHVLATPATVAIMKARYGDQAGETLQSLPYGQDLTINDVKLRFVPAGHVLGSAQVVLEWRGSRVVVSGDYKRGFDPTCAAFEPVEADVFITEATFGLPIFRHPDPDEEIAKLLHSVSLYPERSHVIGAYALGKCQRVIALLRRRDGTGRSGCTAPCSLCARCTNSSAFRWAICVPQPTRRRTSLRARSCWRRHPRSASAGPGVCPIPSPALHRAGCRCAKRAKQRGVELPLVISDHADWDELCRTLHEVVRGEVWVTHGREDALLRMAALENMPARALRLVGFDDDEA